MHSSFRNGSALHARSHPKADLRNMRTLDIVAARASSCHDLRAMSQKNHLIWSMAQLHLPRLSPPAAADEPERGSAGRWLMAITADASWLCDADDVDGGPT